MQERHYETHEPVELYVEVGKGSVSVRATDTTETHVAVEGRDEDDVLIEQDGRRISVIAPKSRMGGFLSGDDGLRVAVTVPTGSELGTRTGSADVQAEGTYAALRVKSGSGEVRVDTVTGPALVETGSGDIEMAEAGAELQVKSGSGDVNLGRTTGQVAVSTGSGDVEIGTTASVVAKTGSGDLRVGQAEGDVSLTTGSGDLSVGTARRGRVTIKGASGDVVVGIPAGTPVWTDITTVSGRLRSDLASVGEPGEGQDHVELRARTVSGDVVLRQV